MSRPRPKVILEHTDRNTYRSQQILAAQGIWAVFYDGQAINLKTANTLINYPGPKYRKVSFSNRGHAINLARKLNSQFHTDKFTVVLLTQGETVYPDEKSKT